MGDRKVEAAVDAGAAPLDPVAMPGAARNRFPLAPLLLAGVAACGGCKAFDINVGTKEPIKLDPIKVDLNMRVDVYQYDGNTADATKEEVANRNEAAKRMRDRGAEIQELKNNRLVGENHLGLLSIRNRPAGDYGDYVERTVDAENGDRIFMMTDISNRTGDALAAVRRDQWQKRAAASFEGEWIEVEGEVPGAYRWAEAKR